MTDFDQNVKIFSSGAFLRNILNAHISFPSIKKAIVVKDKRGEDKIHCYNMSQSCYFHSKRRFSISHIVTQNTFQ